MSLCFLGSAGAQPAAVELRAVRAEDPPRLDGVLDDAVWLTAPLYAGFTQQEPDEGDPATEATEVQLAYDDEALYVAITCHDREPEGIVARLARRDGRTEADRVSVFIDGRHDHQTGCYFQVNAAGTLEDGHISNDGEGWESWDDTWNGVWDARVAIHDAGWNAEYRIPYHCLRFHPADSYTWGVNFRRRISRKQERTYFVMVPSSESGFVSRFAHLTGIEGIHPTRALEILPYTVGRSTFAPAGDADHRDVFANLGADVRYGITSGISLNATANPDFGQVESDPAELNLSVFETFQDERRPFFLEGGADFKTPIQLFYSRRVGRQPGYFDPPDDWEKADGSDFTNILAAVKVTGRTAGRTTFGLLEAVTSQEHARIESTFTDAATGAESAARRDFLLEPRANVLVGRVKQDLLEGSSHIGVIGTALNRQGAESAYTGGVDFATRWRDSAYELSGQVAGNRTQTEDGFDRGWASQAALSKRNGWLRGHLRWESFSDGFEINDLGFQWRDDYYNGWLRVELRRDEPWGPFQRNELMLNHWGVWNFDDVNLEHGIEVGAWNRLQNFWEFGFWAAHRFRARDDLDTRGGPLIVSPAFTEFFSFVESDSRKAVSGFVFANWGNNTQGTRWRRLEPRITFRPSSHFEFRLQPRVHWEFRDAQWVGNFDDDGDDEDDVFVYGQLKTRTLDLTTRASILFHRDLSLEFYLQPFTTSGDYRGFKSLAQPSSYEFTPYPEYLDREDDPDFLRRSLQSNLVLRWEYRPGSTLFLVWSQAREREYERARFRPVTDAVRSFTDDGSNIFLAKLNFWLSR